MSNKINQRKKILNKIIEASENESVNDDDVNFVNEMNESGNIKGAIDNYIDDLIADSLSHAFLGDDFDTYN